MIIGRDLLHELDIGIDFSTKTVHWHDVNIPMKNTEATVSESFHITDPKGINKMIDQISGDKHKKYWKLNMKGLT